MSARCSGRGGDEASAPAVAHWSPADAQENFGDVLGPVVVGFVAQERGLPSPKAVRLGDDATPHNNVICAVGSILHLAPPGAVVWGAGVNGKVTPRPLSPRLDVRAVRGPLTAAWLEGHGVEAAVCGDPALLMSRFFDPPPDARSPVVVLNLHDRLNRHDRRALRSAGARVLSARSPWQEVVAGVASAEFVISSSLHGLVVADSYGIPNRWLDTRGPESHAKFFDHLLSVGKKDLRCASTVAEALEMGDHDRPTVPTDELMASFPSDLWGR